MDTTNSILDYEPLEAVDKAKEEGGFLQFHEELVTLFRAKTLSYLQSRYGNRENLEKAISKLFSWARKNNMESQYELKFMLGMLLDSRKVSSRLEQIDLLTTDMPSRVFSAIKKGNHTIVDITMHSGGAEADITPALRDLERNGLIARFGFVTGSEHFFPTVYGKKMYSKYKGAKVEP